MRDWVPEDDLSHFVLEAVNRVPMSTFVVNERGTGSAQYHPRMMLALLVYCYANGIFGSRRIERATYRDIGVRYVASNCHPDHDTICAFRRNNFEAVAKAFEQVLLLAKELKLLRVGTVSLDGTKVDANANKRNNIRHDRAKELRGEIETLLARAEQEDREDASDPQALPQELSRHERLRDNPLLISDISSLTCWTVVIVALARRRDLIRPRNQARNRQFQLSSEASSIVAGHAMLG